MNQVKKQPSPFYSFKRKNVIQLVFFTFLLATSLSVVNLLKNSLYFPIKTVKISGAQHIDHAVLQSFLTSYVNHGFFGVEVNTIKDRLLENTWITEAKVRRIWPDQVLIKLIEKNPIARWGKTSILSTQGDLFTPDKQELLSYLPQFYGPDGKQQELIQHYHTINQLLAPLHILVIRLELTATDIWHITLTNGIQLKAARKDFLTHFSHFVKVYPKVIGNRETEVNYVDLRYPNGIAVQWKTII